MNLSHGQHAYKQELHLDWIWQDVICLLKLCRGSNSWGVIWGLFRESVITIAAYLNFYQLESNPNDRIWCMHHFMSFCGQWYILLGSDNHRRNIHSETILQSQMDTCRSTINQQSYRESPREKNHSRTKLKRISHASVGSKSFCSKKICHFARIMTESSSGKGEESLCTDIELFDSLFPPPLSSSDLACPVTF